MKLQRDSDLSVGGVSGKANASRNVTGEPERAETDWRDQRERDEVAREPGQRCELERPI